MHIYSDEGFFTFTSFYSQFHEDATLILEFNVCWCPITPDCKMTISNLYLSRLHFLDKPKFLYWIYWKLEKMYLYVKTLKKYKNQDSVSILNFRKVIHIQMFEMITSDERFTVAVKAFILSDISQRVSVISVKLQ